MTEHKIQIEGLPEGWEPISAKAGCVSAGDGELFVDAKIRIRRIVKKYDWSKTLGGVLVRREAGFGLEQLQECTDMSSTYLPTEIWQPNINGVCPADPDASWVRIKRADGGEAEMLASNVCWGFGFGAVTVVGWQFLRLADGWEW